MKTDWVAEVFTAMRDCGEDISIVYAHKGRSAASAEPQWHELPHDQFDGMSGLGHLLRKQGCRVEKLPQLRGEALTLRRALRGFFTVLPFLKVRQRQWQRFDGARAVAFKPVSERVAWHVFTEEQSTQIVSAAKTAGVTVNTYLLFHLDAAVAAQLTPAGSSRRWMIPVNLRGAVVRHNENAPHMSFLALELAAKYSLGELQAQISSLKQRACHWGSWIALHAGKLIGAKAMRRDVRNRERRGHGWTGIFSNLGAWEVQGAGRWIFGPAISRVYPVGAGCVTMNGCMALTTQLHDAFGTDLAAAYALLHAWRQACLPDAGSEITNPTPMQRSAIG